MVGLVETLETVETSDLPPVWIKVDSSQMEPEGAEPEGAVE